MVRTLTRLIDREPTIPQLAEAFFEEVVVLNPL